MKNNTSICFKCKEKKPVNEFAVGKKGVGCFSYCKVCRAEYDKLYYLKNIEKYSKTRKEGRQRRSKESQAGIVEYLTDHPCVDCGESNIIILTFDHVKDKKLFNISDAVSNGMKWERIEKEIKKCAVRCANCHLEKTAKEKKWWTTRI